MPEIIPLGDRMKILENVYNIKIPKDQYIIVRLDGRSFSKFTNGFKRPFDINFIKAMNLTQIDILNKFPCQTVYCHSDEITVIFDIKTEEQEQIFSGRIQKILTTLSSYCSVRFNYHVTEIMKQYENTDTYF